MATNVLAYIAANQALFNTFIGQQLANNPASADLQTVYGTLSTGGPLTTPSGIIGSAVGDIILGTAVAESINGGAGNDTITGAALNDTITGGVGNDTINVDAGTDTITDLTTGDILVVSAGATAAATTAAFVATAATSNDGTATLTADAAGGNISVALAVGANGFTLAGAAGADTLVGGAAADTITGGAGNDTITGGAGNDTINAGIGTDTITDAGNGADTITHDSAASTVAIAVTGTGVVTLTASQAGATATSAVGINTTVNAGTSSAAVTLLGNTGADTLTGSAAADTITGGDGADSLVGGAGADSLVGGAGADTLVGGNGADNLTGGADADTFDFTGADATIDTITDWGVGADVLTGTLSAGGQLNVTIDNASTTAFTAAGIAATNGVVSVTGGLANDTITGGAGADSLTGGEGNDDIMGGAGSDAIVLTETGAGTDIVRYTNVAEFGAPGTNTTFDTVTGFVLADDTVRFTAGGDIETGVIDDVAANDTIDWDSSAIDGTTTAVNLATAEAIHLTQAAGTLDLTDLAAVAILLDAEVNLTSASGADALIAIQSGGRTGLYLFTEDGVVADAVSAGELTLIGTVDALLATGNFAIAA